MDSARRETQSLLAPSNEQTFLLGDENGEGVRLDINHPFIAFILLDPHILLMLWKALWPDKH